MTLALVTFVLVALDLMTPIVSKFPVSLGLVHVALVTLPLMTMVLIL